MKVPPLVEVMRDPQSLPHLSLADWDILLPQLRAAGLLPALYGLVQQNDLQAVVPSEVSRHLEGAFQVQQQQRRTATYELKWLGKIFQPLDKPIILLKGAAYIYAGLEAGAGRLISDIDILVRRSDLDSIELALKQSGWTPGEIDPYNERYYRTWMHEIPPLYNPARDVTLDVHHTLLPATTIPELDANLLFDDLRQVGPQIYTLSPTDMVLHSAAHLFHEGDFGHGLRDLWDLDRLMREFSRDEAMFWEELVRRAEQLHVGRSLYYALRYVRIYFETPIPEAVVEAAAQHAPTFPGVSFMDGLFRRGMLPTHPTTELSWTGLAEFFLYVRSHYLRMPLYLLIPHLLRKSWMDLFPEKQPDPDEEAHPG